MNREGHKRIIISGGGTGGHVFPAIAIANALKQLEPDIKILFVGALDRLEMEKVPAAGYEIVGLPVAGIDRRNVFRNLGVLIRLIKSLRLAKKTLNSFRPDVAVGVGGYASGPVLKQASKMGIPILIQEQNSYAGVTNRLLAGKASVICVAYDGMEKYFPAVKIIKTGNPVRQSLENMKSLKDEALRFFGFEENLPVVLVLGGSLGAGSINKCLSSNILGIYDSGCQWLWQTGRLYYDAVMQAVPDDYRSRISVHPFIDRMELAYAVADVIISRAGAGTISELAIVGKPVILVPSPNVAEDHQSKNAAALVLKEAAIMVPDNEIAHSLIGTAISLSKDEKRKMTLSGNIAKMAERGSDMRIAREVLKLAK